MPALRRHAPGRGTCCPRRATTVRAPLDACGVPRRIRSIAARMLELLAVEAVLLALVLTATATGATALGFGRADCIAIVFSGSKKSLVNGLPMAAVLFGAKAGLTVLPLMMFHQMQLIVCAVIARRWSRRPAGPQQEHTAPAVLVP